METNDRQSEPARYRFAELEQALMEEFLGCPMSTLNSLHPDEAKKRRIAASLYASLHMEEMRARAHLVMALHGGGAHLSGLSTVG